MIIKRKLRLCLLLTLAMFASGAMIAGEALAADWFNEDWSYRKMITVVGPVINGPHVDFPMLVSLASDSELAANAQANGGDILFTSSDGTSKLSHEIEYYNSGTLVAWVRIPAPGIDNGTVIYMYYGDTDYATNGDQWETDGSTWNSNYVMVQHLQESPSDGVAGHLDSTSNSNDGTPNNFENSVNGTTDATGQINGADDFAGDDDYVRISSPSFSTITTGNLTVIVWFNLAQDTTGTLMAQQNGGGTGRTWIIYASCGASMAMGSFLGLGDAGSALCGTTYPSTGVWYHVAVTYNGTDLIIYVNGEQENSDTRDIDESATEDFIIGAHKNLGSEFFNGSMDEVRISSTDRSVGWIKTSYNNQKTPSAFLTVSEQVSIPTMTEWGMIIFMVLTGLVSIYYLRRQRIKN